MKDKIYLKVILLAALLFGLSSCGVWYNFKAYFNSYYNAKVLFDQVEANMAYLPVDLFSFNEPTIQAQDFLALTKVNEKCSKIMQFDTHSGYFIDALWLSGKSFYYQKEYIKAERKFKELLTIEQDPVKLIEVNLWLGKTELQLRNFDEGIKLLDQVAADAIKNKEDDLFSSAVIKQIAFLIYKERYNEAIDKCTQFINNSGDNEKNAQVAFELGKFYYKNNNYEKAATAFKSVSDFSPTFETGFRSKLEYAKCIVDMGKVDEGIVLLNDLKNKSQYAQYMDEISVELGTGYYLNKDYAKALDIFTKVDTVYYGSKSSGVAEYMKGQIYEYHLPNFDSAYVYYDAANGNGLLGDDMKGQIGKKTNIFMSYISKRNDINKDKKQIFYALDKKQYLLDSVLYVEAVYRDTLGQSMRMLQGNPGLNANQLAQNPNGLNQLGQNQIGQPQMGQNQTGQAQMGQTTAIAGQNRDTDSPVQQIPQNAMGNQSNQDMTNQQNQANQMSQQKLGLSSQGNSNYNRRNIVKRIVKKKALPPKPELARISADSIKTNLSSRMFSLANLFYTDMDLPDSAEYYYKKIISDYPKKLLVPNAYYALGTVYLTSNKKEKADSLFKIVYNNYKTTPLGISAAKKLGLIEDTPVNDAAENVYIEAEKKYYDKNYTEAISTFRSLINQYPKSKLSPKSAYYIAFIFENDIKNVDSTIAAYEYLSKKFPEADITRKVQGHNAVYQEEKAKRPQPKPQTVQNNAAPKNQTDAKGGITGAQGALPDSIKAMMIKAQLKDALKERQQKSADSLKAVKDKLK